MEKIIKASAVYELVSAFAIVVVWVLIISFGLIREEISAHPIQFCFLIAAEAVTACLLFISAIGLLKRSEKALKLFFISMGMLLYAVIFAAGKFLSLGFPYFAVMFLAVSIATVILLSVHLIIKL